MPTADDRTALYRLFDSDGRLLYVGISSRPQARWAQHKTGKKWWHEVATRTLEWHETRNAARRAETVAIDAESPAYNIVAPVPPGRAIRSLTIRLDRATADAVGLMAQVDRTSVAGQIRAALDDLIAARRADPEFSARLRRSIDRNQRALERLAE